jgi:preprotein translocase subunit SecD
VRGFAITLVIGLLSNLFTAIYVSRTIFAWHLARMSRQEELSI